MSPRFGAARAIIAIVATCLVAPCVGARAQSAAPIVFTARGEDLLRTRTRLRAGDTALTTAYAALLDDARHALAVPPLSVTQKHRLPESGDRHDYMSFAPYSWPDSTKPNGLPYINRDGMVNPESRVDSDRQPFGRMSEAVETLALAYFLSDDEQYARHAALLLKTWFLDSATRMNPNLKYGQAIPGVTAGRGIGLIDTRSLAQVVDAVGLLRGSPSWTRADDQGMRAWARDFLNWMRTSRLGHDEETTKNNHGTWYNVQAASLALFVGDSAEARAAVVRGRDLIGSQIQSDGREPEELRRTRSLSYSVFNVDAHTRLAELARFVGIDLWRYRSPSGGSLRAALLYLAPYTAEGTKWPGQQITPVDPREFLGSLRRADGPLADATLRSAIGKVAPRIRSSDRSRLLYPDAP
ncbi:MAG TPA: alginate lyase family protein [Gemmatimonadaceae bacterium]|jgi:hypothetical protein